MTRRGLTSWLLANGFVEAHRGGTGHSHYEGHGTKVTVAAHGRQHVHKALASTIIRQLEKAGFSREQLKKLP